MINHEIFNEFVVGLEMDSDAPNTYPPVHLCGAISFHQLPDGAKAVQERAIQFGEQRPQIGGGVAQGVGHAVQDFGNRRQSSALQHIPSRHSFRILRGSHRNARLQTQTMEDQD